MVEKKGLIGVLLFSLVLIVSGMIPPGLANGSIMALSVQTLLLWILEMYCKVPQRQLLCRLLISQIT
jgi:hypothetical protein